MINQYDFVTHPNYTQPLQVMASRPEGSNIVNCVTADIFNSSRRLSLNNLTKVFDSNTLLAVGTKVQMSPAGKRTYCERITNPYNMTGTITFSNEQHAPFVYQVEWDNGSSNSYKKGDLIPLGLLTGDGVETPSEASTFVAGGFYIQNGIIGEYDPHIDCLFDTRLNFHPVYPNATLINLEEYEMTEQNVVTINTGIHAGKEGTIVSVSGEYARVAVDTGTTPLPILRYKLSNLTNNNTYLDGAFYVLEKDGNRFIGEYCAMNNIMFDTRLYGHKMDTITVIRQIVIS